MYSSQLEMIASARPSTGLCALDDHNLSCFARDSAVQFCTRLPGWSVFELSVKYFLGRGGLSVLVCKEATALLSDIGILVGVEIRMRVRVHSEISICFSLRQ